MSKIEAMTKEIEERFRGANPSALNIRFDWIERPHVITYPTGYRAYFGRFEASAACYRTSVHHCGFDLDGSFSYFN